MRILTVAIEAGTHLHDDISATFEHLDGAHVLDNTEVSEVADMEWTDVLDTPAFPLTAEDAAALVDEDGRVAVTLLVDQERFLTAHGALAAGWDFDQYDLVHERAFDFGVTDDPECQIVGVCGRDFVVTYSTNLAPFLTDAD